MRSALVLPLLFAAATLPLACTSVDAERSELRRALDDASGLAVEIDGWEQRSSGAITQMVVETINSFQTRADHILDTIAGISEEARAGVDLAGVKQALNEIIDFDTSRVAEASDTGRSSIVHQFARLAESLGNAVVQVGRV